MPTILMERGFSIMIYTRDHPPPHVHAWRQGIEAVIEIGDDPVVRKNDGLNRRDLATAIRIVKQNRDGLLFEWRRIHG